MIIQKALLYLLLLLLPTQLGRHFFFPFSSIAGIRSDYLTPTLYLTDVIILLLISFNFLDKIKNLRLRRVSFSLSAICYLLFNVLFVATNKGAALYTFIKVVEYVLFGAIIVRLKPKMHTVITVFTIDVLYISFITFGQFILQQSIGGVFWFLGERTFYATTPGIAVISLGGRLLLRPYATFPHPNVLGGFLAIALPFILVWVLTHKKELHLSSQVLHLTSFVLGTTTLFLSFSKSAWFVFLLGIFLIFLEGRGKIRAFCRRKKSFFLALFYLFLFLSVIIPFSFDITQESVIERKNLLHASIEAILSQPLFGIGLNNSIVRFSSFLPHVFNFSFFQPVHNIYVLIFVETGFLGFTFFLFFFTLIFTRVLKNSLLIRIALLQLFLLGLFDHYLLTLQQGQLLSTLFISLALTAEQSTL